MIDEKQCTRCKEIKPLGAFNRHRYSPDGHAWQCRACNSKHAKKFRGTPAGIYLQLKGQVDYWHDKPFKLVKEVFIDWYENEPKVCAYCGLIETELPNIKDSSNDLSKRLSIDCVENSVGYVIGNIVLACRRCNMIKSDILSYDDMCFIGRRFIKPIWGKQLNIHNSEESE